MSAEGFSARMVVEAGSGSNTYDGSSEMYVFDSETLGATRAINDNHGIRGTRARHDGRVTDSLISVGGTITMRPGRLELDAWLPRILGAAEAATDTFSLADTLPVFSVGLLKAVNDFYDYRDCVVSRAVFSASSGNPLQLALDIVGKSETNITTPTFPTWNPGTGNRPMEMSEGVLTLVSASRYFEDFELTIDNAVTPKFRNSQTAVFLDPSDRIVTLKASLDWTTTINDDIYALGSAGTAGDIEFTSSDGMVTTFNFVNLVPIDDTIPKVSGKTDVLYPVTFQAYATSSAAAGLEVQVINDPVV